MKPAVLMIVCVAGQCAHYIRRRYLDPTPSVRECVVNYDPKSQLVDVETNALFLVADENDDEMKAQIWIIAVESQQRAFNTEGQFVGTHRRDYTGSVALDLRQVNASGSACGKRHSRTAIVCEHDAEWALAVA
jgi:hypothetical protein